MLKYMVSEKKTLNLSNIPLIYSSSESQTSSIYLCRNISLTNICTCA
uniref:Uncharacterized protein n=1 Tax=Arundo donax TaxID=35708 RepID=A0A0A9B965_ARUDO